MRGYGDNSVRLAWGAVVLAAACGVDDRNVAALEGETDNLNVTDAGCNAGGASSGECEPPPDPECTGSACELPADPECTGSACELPVDPECTGSACELPVGPECEGGVTRCNENGQLEMCASDGRWGAAEPCPFVCSNGACSGECVPDSTTCNVDGLTPRRCDANGEWQEGEACAGVCTNGACAGACTPETKQCASNSLQLCDNDGKWQLDEECSFNCNSELLACTGECAPNAQRCGSGRLQSCGAEATWNAGVTCPFVCATTAADRAECSGSCVPTRTECVSETSVRTCGADGEWLGAVACTQQACGGTPAACRGECAPSSQQCTDNAVQTCTAAGEWESVDDCGDQTCTETSASSARCEGECAPGQTTCISGNAQTCDAGRFELSDECDPDDQICRDGACASSIHAVGNSSLAAGTVGVFGTFVSACPLPELTHDAVLLTLGMAGNAGGVFARMVLYADAAGEPSGAPVAQSGGQNFPVLAGTLIEVLPSNSNVTLRGGQTYWLGVVTNVDTQLRSTANAAVRCRLWGQAFDQAFGAAQSGNPFNGNDLNMFITVRDVQ